ncbi:MAG: hypothetical protein WD096_06100 [Actinomycetota bacterium]
MHRSIRASVFIGAIALAALPARAALAHGDADDGPISVVLGFGTEPAYAGLPNSVQVLLEHDGEPVTGATDLTVDVTYGDQTATFGLEPHPASSGGAPGEYRASFVPSQPGPYTFHVMGDVQGEAIDIEMTSGADTFAEVQATTAASFPAVDAPSAEELAGRLGTESARVTAAMEVAAHDAAGPRRTAIIGLAVGAIGVITGIGGLAASRRTRA